MIDRFKNDLIIKQRLDFFLIYLINKTYKINLKLLRLIYFNVLFL